MDVAQGAAATVMPTSTNYSERDDSLTVGGVVNNKAVGPAAATLAKTLEGAAAVKARGALDPSATRKLSVLLVEDDPATLTFVKAMLKSCGHTGERGFPSTARSFDFCGFFLAREGGANSFVNHQLSNTSFWVLAEPRLVRTGGCPEPLFFLGFEDHRREGAK